MPSSARHIRSFVHVASTVGFAHWNCTGSFDYAFGEDGHTEMFTGKIHIPEAASVFLHIEVTPGPNPVEHCAAMSIGYGFRMALSQPVDPLVITARLIDPVNHQFKDSPPVDPQKPPEEGRPRLRLAVAGKRLADGAAEAAPVIEWGHVRTLNPSTHTYPLKSTSNICLVENANSAIV